MSDKVFMQSDPLSIQVFLSHDRMAAEVNLYFLDIFSEVANIQFEVNVEPYDIDLTSLERMIRNSDAFIGIYPFDKINDISPSIEELSSKAKRFQLEIEAALRSKKPIFIFYDERFGSLFRCPPPIQAFPFNMRELISEGAKPSMMKHKHAFQLFLNKVNFFIKYQTEQITQIPINRRVLILFSEEMVNNSIIRNSIGDVLVEFGCEFHFLSQQSTFDFEFYAEIQKSDWVIAAIADNLETALLAAFLQGYFVPLIRLVHCSNVQAFNNKNVIVKYLDSHSPQEIIGWNTEDDLREGIKKKISRILAPKDRITTYKAARQYFLKDSLRQESVFLSYTGSDLNVANILSSELKTRFKKVIDYRDGESLFSGQLWREQIEHLLQNITIAIPLLSSDFLASQNCLSELSKILSLKDQRKIFVAPIKVRKENLILPDNLAAINYIRLWEYPDMSSLVNRLIQSYKIICKHG